MKLHRIIALGVLCFASAGYSQADSGSSADATASVRIVRPLKLQNIRPLNFGSLVRGSSGEGSATMAPTTVLGETVPTVAGGLTSLTQGSVDILHQSMRGPATFLVQGEPHFFVTVTLPANDPVFMINRDENPDIDKLPVTDFSISGGSTTLQLQPGSNPAVGLTTFSVGATVTVPHDAPAGWYDGQFHVTVAYN